MKIPERERLEGQSDLAYILEAVRIYQPKALQALLGCSKSRASDLWHGRIVIGGRTALKLSNLTGIPADTFLRVVARPRPRKPVADG